MNVIWRRSAIESEVGASSGATPAHVVAEGRGVGRRRHAPIDLSP
mgnify:CR=1 FL=1